MIFKRNRGPDGSAVSFSGIRVAPLHSNQPKGATMSALNPSSDFGEVPVTPPSSNLEMGDTGESVRQLNSLLRGEISAAETYRNVLDKVTDGDHPQDAGLLRQIQEEHGR